MHKIPQVLPPQGSKARHFTIQWSDWKLWLLP
jgi:hypothetical protein